MQISPANWYLHATVWPDRDMQIWFGPLKLSTCTHDIDMKWKAKRPWLVTFRLGRAKWICMSRSEVRPWHADISWPVISACPKFRKNPKSINLGGGFRNTWLHATVWPQTRTCKGFWNFGLLAPISPKYFACHGLTSDQDMQGVSEFWGCLP